jgi:hypothetical protein
MSDVLVPLEDDEQIAVVQWLELQGLKFTAIPNHTYTTSWKQKNHNKRLGLRAGLCDMLVLVPPARSVDGKGYALFIEMKRTKGSTTSAEQKAWIEALNGLEAASVAAYVAKGADVAIDIISRHLKPGTTPSPF